MDFSEYHSEEVISFFWRSVYFIMICVLNQTLSLLHNYAPHIFYRLKVLMSMNQMDLKYRQLRARRALSPYTLYSNSALLVLNGTSLSCNNALLASRLTIWPFEKQLEYFSRTQLSTVFLRKFDSKMQQNLYNVCDTTAAIPFLSKFLIDCYINLCLRAKGC